MSLEVALNDLGWIGFRRVPSISNTRPPRTTRPVLSASARAGGALLLLLAVFNAGCARDAEPAQAPSWSEAQPANYASYPSYAGYPAYSGYGAPHPPYGSYIPGATYLGPGGAYPSAPTSQPPALAEGEPSPSAPAADPTSGATPPAPPAALPALPTPAPGAEPALRYSNLSPDACLAELATRKLAVEAYPPNTATRDVATPVRLTGALNNVNIVMNGAKQPGSQGQLDVMDCRLALSLDDWTKLLAQRGVRTLHHASMLRPGARIRQSGKPSQHGLGLAIDIAALSLQDGTRLEILRDFGGEIGAPVCTQAQNPSSDWLRRWTCETHAGRYFNLILTPNYNADHKDHIHLDLEPGKTWFNLH